VTISLEPFMKPGRCLQLIVVSLGEAPFSLVTTPAVEWAERIVVPGGETRPGVGSPVVWGLNVRGMEAGE